MAYNRRRRTFKRSRRRSSTTWAYFAFLHRLSSSQQQFGIADVLTHTGGTGAGDADNALRQGFTDSEASLATKLHANALGVWGPVVGDTSLNSVTAFRQIVKPYTIKAFHGTLSVYVEDESSTGGIFMNHVFGINKSPYTQSSFNNEYRGIYSVESPQVRVLWEDWPEYTFRGAQTANQMVYIKRVTAKANARVDRFNTPFLSSTKLFSDNPAGTSRVNVRFAGKCLVHKDLG